MGVASSLDLPALLRRRLESGEIIVWEGSPDGSRSAASQGGWFAVGLLGMFNIALWLALAAGGFSGRDPSRGALAVAFVLIGLPIAVLAFVALCAPLSALVRGRRTLYAITDRRVIIMRGPGEGGFEAYAPSDLSDIRVRGEFRNVGDVVFARAGTALASGGILVRPARFSMVRNSTEVARMLHGLAAERSTAVN